MVDLAMLQVVRDLVAIFGVIAGFSYYVLTVRNANLARRTEQAIRLLNKNQDVENNRIWAEVYRMEWSDYDDFMKKYGRSVNPDLWAKRLRIWGNYNEMGYMLYNNQIDIETVNRLMGDAGAIHIWNKFGSIIAAMRKRFNDKDHYRWLEHVAKEMGKERARQGVKPDITDIIEYTA